MITGAAAKVVKTAQCAKQPAAKIVNLRKGCDNAVRRFSSTFVQDGSGTGHLW